MLFRMLYDDKLAQAAYLIGCQQTGEALIVDPQRDVARYINEADKEGLKITAITETHIHADFLSGAREMAERTGAKVYLSDEGGPDWQYKWLNAKQGGGSYPHQLLKDHDTFNIGNIEIKAVHTPGHTPEHLCFIVTDHGGGATEPMGIASGDFIFVGDVGRPDLLETAAGQAGTKEQSARVLFKSIKRFQALPDYLQLWPGHGAGSACGKALGAVPQSTVGYEKRFNPAIGDAATESQFVESILAGQPEPPLYFARMKRENRDGPALLGTLPNPGKLNPDALRAIANSNSVILDTRPWAEFSRGHLPKALFAPLSTSFPTVAGSYVEPGVAIYLIVDEDKLHEAIVDLIHVGLDDITGYATTETITALRDSGMDLETSESIEMVDLKNHLSDPDVQVLDVRRASEYSEGHLANAINIAHTRLLARIDEVPRDKKLMVHCRSGERSSYATAMLASHGFDAVQLDGGLLAWEQAGGEIVVDRG